MNRNLTILLVEDDEDYSEIFEGAIRANGWRNPIRVVRDGQEACRYLSGEGKYTDREAYPFPSVMFLDLKMTGVNGFDVLRWIKENPEYTVLPTVVLSTSDYEKDVKLAYSLGANGYLAKPAHLDDLKKMLQAMYDYWSWCLKPRVTDET